MVKVLFRDTERTFRDVEYIFRDAERTFRDTEYNFKHHYNRITVVLMNK